MLGSSGRPRSVHMRKRLSIAAALLLGGVLVPPVAQAQGSFRDAVNTAGTRMSSDRGTLIWTLGDLSAALYTTPVLRYREGYLCTPVTVTELLPLPLHWSAHVYPHPVHSTLRIAFNAAHEAGVIRLHDAVGKELLRRSFEGGELEIQIEFDAIPSGSYTLWLQNSAGTTRGGFLIQKVK